MESGSIHVALVRVAALAGAWQFSYRESFGGCRSWIRLPEPPAGWRDGLQPVLGDDAFATISERAAGIVGVG
jgi:hypothetical protein